MAHDMGVQQVMAWFVSLSGMMDNVDGKMEFWISSVDAAEAETAEGSSVTALLIPSLLQSTVELVCDHWMSSRSTFNIFVIIIIYYHYYY